MRHRLYPPLLQVRISMDCSLRMVSLLPPEGAAAQAAACWPALEQPGQRAVAFPFGVLEMKLNDADAPAWCAWPDFKPPRYAPPCLSV